VIETIALFLLVFFSTASLVFNFIVMKQKHQILKKLISDIKQSDQRLKQLQKRLESITDVVLTQEKTQK